MSASLPASSVLQIGSHTEGLMCSDIASRPAILPRTDASFLRAP